VVIPIWTDGERIMDDPLAKKIDLFKQDDSNLPTQSKNNSKKIMPTQNPKKRIIKIFASVWVLAIFLAVIFFFFIFQPALKVYAGGLKTYEEAKKIYDAIKTQNLPNANEKIAATKTELEKTQKSLEKLSWIRFIPFFGNYYQDADHLIIAANNGLEAGKILTETLIPYADIIGFKGQGSFMGGTAEERVTKIVQTIDKVSPKLGEVIEKLKLARSEIEHVNPKRYPKSVKGIKIQESLQTVKAFLEDGTELLAKAKPVIEVLPQILGEPEEKRYLVLFQNDAELRPTGGFWTAFAVLRVDHGKINPVKSDDIYALDEKFNSRIKAPEPILKHHINVHYWYLRDMNLSPDFSSSAQTFTKYYNEIKDEEKVNGIITVDTKFLKDLLDVLGPVGVSGYGTFSTEIEKKCNCPQVIYQLELLADKPTQSIRRGRKDVLGPLMHSILLNALGSAKQTFPKLLQATFNNLFEKHVFVYFFEEKFQKAMEDFGIAGRIVDFDGDYLHINDCNFAGAKSNMYVQQEVEKKTEISENGTVKNTLTIKYKNSQPWSDCNLEAGELCLNGELRDWIRIYVPKGSKLLRSEGSELDIVEGEDLGKTVFEGFFTLRPESARKLEFVYELPQKVQKGQEYKLLIQKQGGILGPKYTIMVDGQKKEFELKTDEELEFKL